MLNYMPCTKNFNRYTVDSLLTRLVYEVHVIWEANYVISGNQFMTRCTGTHQHKLSMHRTSSYPGPFRYDWSIFRHFFQFFFFLVWMPATLFLWFLSNLRSECVRCLSFLGEKTEIMYLYYSPFYTYMCTEVKICAKQYPKCCVHC